MRRSTFTLDYKLVKIKPLYKEGSKTDPKNYRSVSLLPFVAKVIQKVVDNQTKKFLNKNRTLYKCQTEIRKSFSRNSSSTWLTDKINKCFGSGKYTGLIAIDLQKAHEIMIRS